MQQIEFPENEVRERERQRSLGAGYKMILRNVNRSLCGKENERKILLFGGQKSYVF